MRTIATVAKLKISKDPFKKDTAWLCDFEGQKEVWIPYSCITAYLPATKEITVQKWMLNQKGIKYKTK